MKLIDLPGELAKEAHRIVTEYSPGTAAHGIGLKLYEMVTSVELPASAMPNRPTTNLNFWQAYQAMKRGEWVRSPKWSDITLYGYMKDGELYLRRKDGADDEWSIFNPFDFDFEEWCIVPKGPRYKAGDRFCFTDLYTETILEIVHCDEMTRTYAVSKTVNKEPQGLDIFTEDRLNAFRKLPS